MAFAVERIWTLKKGFSLTVRDDQLDKTGADVVVDCFQCREDRVGTDLNWSSRSGCKIVQLPLPHYKERDSILCTRQFKENFKKLLVAVAANQMQKIAFPIDRVTEWPLKMAVEATREAVKEMTFSEHAEEDILLMICVRMENYEELIKICDSLFVDNQGDGIESPIDKHVCIAVKEGFLDDTKADVIACTMSPDMDLRRGSVTKALLEKVGNDLQKDLRTKYRKTSYDNITVLPNFNLPCKKVFFGVMLPFAEDIQGQYKDEEEYYAISINDFMRACLQTAEHSEYTSIAFPAIGCGSLGFDVYSVAKKMFDAVRMFQKTVTVRHLREIMFIIFPEDEDALQAFTRAVKGTQDLDVRNELYVKQKKSVLEKTIDHMTHSLKDTHLGTVGKTLTKTYFRENPEKNTQEAVPVPETTYTMLEFFYPNLFKKCKSQNCELDFKEGNIILRGDSSKLKLLIEEIKVAIKLINEEIETDELDITKFNKQDVASKINEVEDVMKVCCIMDEDSLFFYGKRQEDIKQAKDEVIKLLLPPRVNKTEEALSQQSTAHLSLKERNENGTIPTGTKSKPCKVERQFSWSDAKHLRMYAIKQKVAVKVYSANILCLPVKCIVNAANSNLNHGGGIAKVIAQAAGPELIKRDKDYLKKHGSLTVGKACETSVGNLQYDLVIHAVGPCWSDYKPHYKTLVDQCEMDLYNAIINSLSLAEKLEQRDIAIPAVSAGKYGCPVEMCCIQYAKAVLDYCQLSKNPLEEIHFVDKNVEVTKLMQDTFESMINHGRVPSFFNRAVYISQNGDRKTDNRKAKAGTQDGSSADGKIGTRRQHKAETETYYPYHHLSVIPGRPGKVFECCFSPDQSVYIYTADIANLNNIDMVVCGDIPSGKGIGTLTQALLKRGGAPYQKEKEKLFRRKIELGDVVVCKGGNNKFKMVVHAILIPKDNFKLKKDRQIGVNRIFEDIFKSMKSNGCHSLALPLLGTGKGNADPEYYAERFIESLLDFRSWNKGFKFNIHLVNINDKNTDVGKRVVTKAINDAPVELKHALSNKSSSQITNSGKVNNHDKRTNPPPSPAPIKYSTDASHMKQNVAAARSFRHSHSKREPRKRPVSAFQVDTSQFSSTWLDDYGMPDVRKTKNDMNANFAHSTNDSSSEDEEIDEFKESVLGENKEPEEPCVICMDDIKLPKTLPCGHVFCTNCIKEHFTYKKVCPTCGRVCGIITGDQPEGEMKVRTCRESCAGFEKYGSIEITYSFQDGLQGSSHPAPGKRYKGITRTAYLPNNRRGKEVCEMLKVAFDRKLVFTIGRSRTTGADGVITWNDIHHKTDPKPNTQFGYPDPTYLDRVTEELEVKGVLVNDLPTLSVPRQRRR